MKISPVDCLCKISSATLRTWTNQKGAWRLSSLTIGQLHILVLELLNVCGSALPELLLQPGPNVFDWVEVRTVSKNAAGGLTNVDSAFLIGPEKNVFNISR
jgi:hypothetical protein